MSDNSEETAYPNRSHAATDRALPLVPPPATTAGLVAAFLAPVLALVWFADVSQTVQLETVAIVSASTLVIMLISISLFDIAQFRLPDPLVAAILGVGLVVAAVGGTMDLLHGCVGAAIGFGALWLVRYAYRSLRSREGLGLGDVKLLGAGGAWVGADGLALVVTIAAGAALVAVALTKLARPNFDLAQRIAFGPFLAWGIWIVWILGQIGRSLH